MTAYKPSIPVGGGETSEDTKGCDLRFDQHQTLESAVGQYTRIFKNIPCIYVAYLANMLRFLFRLGLIFAVMYLDVGSVILQ